MWEPARRQNLQPDSEPDPEPCDARILVHAARSLLIATVPAAIVGSLITGYVESEILETILGMGLFAVALSFLKAPGSAEIHRLDASVSRDFDETTAETCLITSGGEKICYTVCNRGEGRIIAGLGALFMGMISTGLGELNGYFLLRRCRVPSRVAVATGVFVVAVTALSAAKIHIWRFAQVDGSSLQTVLALSAFTIPGVIIGGQVGPMLASRIPQHILEKILGMLFLLVGALMLGKQIL